MKVDTVHVSPYSSMNRTANGVEKSHLEALFHVSLRLESRYCSVENAATILLTALQLKEKGLYQPLFFSQPIDLSVNRILKQYTALEQFPYRFRPFLNLILKCAPRLTRLKCQNFSLEVKELDRWFQSCVPRCIVRCFSLLGPIRIYNSP